MKRIPMVILAGILLLTPSCDFMKSINPFGKKKAREAEALRQQQEAFRVADSIRVANEKQAEAERQRQAELALAAQQQELEYSRFHVIVGSFLTPSYADAWKEQIRGLGYDPIIVPMNGGRWSLVSAKSFGTWREARNALAGIQDNINGEAWVYRRE